ncbi:MAG: sigma 54-interacting transcriptional regulator [Acidobacteriia bacterium]|nr:sigma 54-interacting transcriptional regulator [Terriglobia bacterium]
MQRTDDEKIQVAERLPTLQRTSLRDTPPEEAFDRLTRLATTLLRVPVALVSLVDGNRRFFKSCVGLPEPLASLRQTSLTHSFCKQVVASGEPLIVSDIRNSNFKDNPSVFGLGEIAYAGVPLTTTEGHALGSFWVVDTRPRKWTEADIEILRSLASSVMTEIGARRMARELRELSNDLQRLVKERTCQLSHAEERWRVLLQVNNALVTCLDRETLLEAIARALRGVIPYDRMALELDDPIEGGFKVMAVAGPVPSPPIVPISTWPRHGSRSGWIVESGLPVLTPDLREDSRFAEHGPLIREGLLSALSVPLRSKGKVIGTLNVWSQEVGRYDESHSELLLAIADQVVLAIQNLLAYEEVASLEQRLEQENLYRQEECLAEPPFADVVGESAVIRKVLAKIRKVAGTDSTVLVTGETGTGKELVVRAIHGLSMRKDKILVKVNCAALPSGVIESELFGHEKGAFTGALTRRVGRFELANGGTLFLDEVGDLPQELQAKLLRVLQEGEFERVGGTQTLKVNVRLIAATNRDLHSAVGEGRFRADLFYRLNVFPIAIPPLRDRVEDVPRLVRHFVMIYASKMGKSIEKISEQVLGKLMAYPWPGNVRELQNVIERAVILSTRGRIELDDHLAAPVAGARTKAAGTLEEIERDRIQSVLERVGWRVSGEGGAASILGLKRTTLEARMGKLGISRPAGSPRAGILPNGWRVALARNGTPRAARTEQPPCSESFVPDAVRRDGHGTRVAVYSVRDRETNGG